jgi:cell division protein FtsB
MKLTKSLTGIIFTALVFLVIFLPGYAKIRQLAAKNRDLLKKNRVLNAENSLLQRELKRLESDQVYQERILREKMGVVRKNEVPVRIIQDESRQIKD